MRFACLDPAARATIITLAAVSAALWGYLGARDGGIQLEEFDLIEGAAVTVSLSLVAVVIGIVLRDSIRGQLVRTIVSNRPGDAAPLHLVKADQDAG